MTLHNSVFEIFPVDIWENIVNALGVLSLKELRIYRELFKLDPEADARMFKKIKISSKNHLRINYGNLIPKFNQIEDLIKLR
jgi:hypothetical protein